MKTERPSPRRWAKRKLLAVFAAVGVLAMGGTAWAAMTLFGFGTLNASAATTAGLKVNNASVQLVGNLVPGTTVGASLQVSNPNDFPVTVTAVVVKDSSLKILPNVLSCTTSVHVVGTATVWPGIGGGAAKLLDVKDVTVAAHHTATILVPQVVKQDLGASILCGLKADIAVKATANG